MKAGKRMTQRLVTSDLGDDTSTAPAILKQRVNEIGKALQRKTKTPVKGGGINKKVDEDLDNKTTIEFRIGNSSVTLGSKDAYYYLNEMQQHKRAHQLLKDTANDCEQMKATLEKTQRTLDKESTEYSTKAHDREKKMNEMESICNNHNARVSELQQIIKDLNLQVKAYAEAKQLSEQQKENLTQRISDLKEENGKMVLEKRQLTSKQNKREEEPEKNATNKLIKKIKSEKNKLKTEKKKMGEENKTLLDENNKLKESLEKLQQYEGQENLKETLKKTQDQLKENEEELNKQKKVSDSLTSKMKNRDKKITQLTKNLEDTKRERFSLNKNVKTLTKTVEEQEKQLSTLQKKHSNVEADLNSALRNISDLEKSRKVDQKTIKQFKTKAAAVEDKTNFMNELKQTMESKMTEVLEIANQQLNEEDNNTKAVQKKKSEQSQDSTQKVNDFSFNTLKEIIQNTLAIMFYHENDTFKQLMNDKYEKEENGNAKIKLMNKIASDIIYKRKMYHLVNFTNDKEKNAMKKITYEDLNIDELKRTFNKQIRARQKAKSKNVSQKQENTISTENVDPQAQKTTSTTTKKKANQNTKRNNQNSSSQQVPLQKSTHQYQQAKKQQPKQKKQSVENSQAQKATQNNGKTTKRGKPKSQKPATKKDQSKSQKPSTKKQDQPLSNGNHVKPTSPKLPTKNDEPLAVQQPSTKSVQQTKNNEKKNRRSKKNIKQ